MGTDGDRWRPGPDIPWHLSILGEALAEEVDREDFDLAVRNLLAIIAGYTFAGMRGLRMNLVVLGTIQATLLGFILWRVW